MKISAVTLATLLIASLVWGQQALPDKVAARKLREERQETLRQLSQRWSSALPGMSTESTTSTSAELKLTLPEKGLKRAS